MVEDGIRNNTSDQFKNHLRLALKMKQNVAFETNFNDSKVLNYLKTFKVQGFQTNLIFLGLASVRMAKERVNQRVAKKGHFVSEDTIEERYYMGLKLLDSKFKQFDRVHIHESLPDYKSKLCAIIKDSDILLKNKFSFVSKLPVISSLINKKRKNKGLSM